MKFLIQKFLLLCIVAIFGLPSVTGQENKSPVCGTDEYYEARKKANPELKQLEEAANNAAPSRVDPEKARMKRQGDPRVIPVVFHVVHEGGQANIDKQRILDNLETMNEDYQKENSDTSLVQNVFKDRIADYNIEFRLARVAPDGTCTNGITRTQSSLSSSSERDAVKSLIRWNTDHYLNIWLVNNIGGGNIAGFAQFPWDNQKDTDGIVALASGVEAGDRTLTHEVGHYLGLFHPFQGGCSTGDCANQNDQVCDVPPTERRRGIVPCNQIDNTCSDPSGEPDMKENFMDYTTCGRMFSEGQKARSEPFITQSRYRAELFSEANLARTGVKKQIDNQAPLASFSTPQSTVCLGQDVQFNNLSCAGSADNIEWHFEGATPETSSSENPVVTYDEPGQYDVTLRMSNSSGADTLTKTEVIKVIEPLQAPVKFTFEDGNLEAQGFEFMKTISGDQWKQTGKIGLSGNKSIYLGNYNIQQEGQNVSFSLPPVNLSGIEDPVLRFEMAYATKSSSSGDMLALKRSENCGQTWRHMKFFFNSAITTKSNVNSPYYPENAEEWKTHEYSLSQLQSSANSRLRFQMQTDQGNNAFIDNVRIERRATSIGDRNDSKNEAFRVYPNPVQEDIQIAFSGDKATNVSFTVANTFGKTLNKKQLHWTPGTTKTFKASELGMEANGLYIIRLQYNNQTVVKRVTLTN